MGPVQHPVADVAGRLIWARELADAGVRPEGAVCVACGEPVRLHAGEWNRPHFSHREGATCTASETALHDLAIRLLAGAITEAMASGRQFPIDLSCERCSITSVGDMGRHRGGRVEVDRVLHAGIRPDLVVRSADGRARYVVEVVVTHSPEPAALAIYRELGLPLITVLPTWDSLVDMRHGLRAELRRTSVNRHGIYDVDGGCRHPRHVGLLTVPCVDCGADARPFSIEISSLPCYRCQAPVRVLDLVRLGDNSAIVAPGCSDLSGVAPVAEARDVRLRTVASVTAGTHYLMHHCAECGAKQGDAYLYMFDSEPPSTMTSEPGWPAWVCAAGHWSIGSARPWPPDAEPGRPQGVGLQGGTADSATQVCEPSISLTKVGRGGITPQQAARRVFGV